MEKSIKLISFYNNICKIYNNNLAFFVRPFSNNQGYITDQELITMYLFSLQEEKKTDKKSMYQYIKDY